MTRLLKLKEVAQALGVVPATVHNMLKNGRCPVDPIPGTKPRRWRASEIEAFVNGRQLPYEEEKLCEKCEKLKPISHFTNATRYKELTRKWCDECCDISLKNITKSVTQENLLNRSRNMNYKVRQTLRGRSYALFIGARLRAEKSGKSFTITIDDIIQHMEKGHCNKSGIPFDFRSISGNVRNPFAPSIDRINNNRGYESNNIQLVCNMYNSGKGDTVEEYFIAMCMAVAEHNKNNKNAIAVLKACRGV